MGSWVELATTRTRLVKAGCCAQIDQTTTAMCEVAKQLHGPLMQRQRVPL